MIVEETVREADLRNETMSKNEAKMGEEKFYWRLLDSRMWEWYFKVKEEGARNKGLHESL